ncbi:MAG: hypothetical protein ACYTFY_22635 [Planctomycetota bacterium]
MKNNELDKHEKEIEDSIQEYKSVSPAKRKKLQGIIKQANEKRNISLRVNGQDLEKNGVKEFAVLPFDEFVKIKNELQDFEDLKDLRSAKMAEEDVPGMNLSDAKKEWEK